ncbi:MAG: GNAT family N-acetyltransferase [Bacteroidales bacterium]|nr:GNAT family N-acetyltransferase [Bacteroidales bacterium]
MITLHKKRFQELTIGELYELLRIRAEVFVVEQNCVYQDLDGDDQAAIHLWLTEGDKVVALARVCPAGTHMTEVSIGRVITTERGRGFGKQIMQAAIDAAQEYFGASTIDIEAQEYAKGFYEGVGFKQSSESFMLDGIPHIKMTWKKDPASGNVQQVFDELFETFKTKGYTAEDFEGGCALCGEANEFALDIIFDKVGEAFPCIEKFEQNSMTSKLYRLLFERFEKEENL